MRFLFGYGSIVSRASVERTLGRVLAPGDGPLEARLDGYRRVWNVGSDSRSHPERTFIREDDGSVYTGVVAVLGLEPASGSTCLGAVVRIGPPDLAPLLSRERNYHLVDVTAMVSWSAKPESCSVHTFMPSVAARQRLAGADEAVIDSHYARRVEEAFGVLGRAGLEEYRTSLAAGSAGTACFRSRRSARRRGVPGDATPAFGHDPHMSELVIELHIPLLPAPGLAGGGYEFPWIEDTQESVMILDLDDDGASEFDDGEESDDHYVFFLTGDDEDLVLAAAKRLALAPGVPGGAFLMVTDSDAEEFGLGRRVELSELP